MSENIKLRCRQCDTIVEPTTDGKLKECSCGKCSIGIDGDKLCIHSSTGVGGYTLLKGDEEYILVSKKELGETDG